MVSLRLSKGTKEKLIESVKLAGLELGTIVTQTQVVEMAIHEFYNRRMSAKSEKGDIENG